MRINLNVPYAEKDEAHRFGAKWDMARKVWYVEDLPNLEPFLRWMPEHLRRPIKSPANSVKQKAKAKQVKPKKGSRKVNQAAVREEKRHHIRCCYTPN
jgi:hypothetical protein